MQQYSDDEYLSNEDPDGGEDSEGEGLDRDDDPQWGERSDEGEDPDDSEGEGLNRDDDPQWDGRPDEGEDSDDSEGEDLNRDDNSRWGEHPDEGEDSDDSEGEDPDRDERPDESEDPDDSEGEGLDRGDDPQWGEHSDEGEDPDDSEGEDLNRDDDPQWDGRPDEGEDSDDSEGEDLNRDDDSRWGEHPDEGEDSDDSEGEDPDRDERPDESEDPDDSEGEGLDRDDDPRWGERPDSESEDSAGGEDYYDGKYAHQVADQDRYEDADEEVRGDKVVDEGSGSDEDSGSDERSRSDEGSGGGSNFGSRSNGQPSHNIFTTASNAHTELLPTQENDSEDGNNDDPYSRRHQWQAPNRPQPSNKDVNSDYNLHSRRQPPNHPQHNEDVNDNSSHPRHQAPTRPQHTNKDVGNDHPHWHPIRALNRLLHKKDGRNNDPHPIHQPPNLPPHKKDGKKNDPHPRRQPPNHPGPSNPPRHQPSNHPGRKDLPRLPDRPGHNDFSGRQPPNRPGRKDLPQLPDRPGHNDFSGRQPPNRLGPSDHPSHQPPNHPGPSNPSPRRQPPNHPGPSDPSPRRQPPNHPGPSDPSPRRQPPNHPGPNDPPPRRQPPNRPPPKKDGNNNDPRPSKLPKPPLPKKVSNHDSHPGPQPLDHPPPNSEHGTKLKTHAKANEINGQSLYDDIKIKVLPTVWNASVAGDLHTAEKLLTQEIDKDGNKYDSCAIRSMVRARSSEWDNALQDAVKSIAIQPSLWGYISKSIALCGNGQLWDAMEAFDLAITFSDRDPVTIDLLLLIKAVVIFNAGRHNEAIRRVQRLTITGQHSDALRCSMVDAYLHVQLAMITFQNGQYSKAADKLTASIATITGLFSPATLLEPRWKIFTLLFGWDFDSLWRTINQRRCDALLHADRVTEAVKSFQYMMSMIDDNTKSGCLEWSSTFKRDCIARCVAKADEAIAASDYEMAVELYSAVIRLDPSHDSFFERRSTAYLAQKHYAQALADADTVIKLSPSSRHGSELRHAALRGAQQSYKKANETFESMLFKLNLKNAPDSQMRALRQQYTEAEQAIKEAIDTHLEKAPLRLLNVSTGRLCNEDAQRNDFMQSKEYSELLYSSMTHMPLQTEPIKKAVAKYFSWVMLSHRWDKEEPMLHDIQDKVVYELKGVAGIEKLQNFCKKARGMGYRWAWSDTCCIDQKNTAEVQRSVNSMFVWYRHSALTMVYLSDVSPAFKSGALENSVWTTRGWTVQEFLAPNVILFYHKDWDLYLNDRSPNHKESPTIMNELERSTGIKARALVTFNPGMKGAREKFRWASRRVTSLPEDIAYSLFGIFGLQLPVLYGETKECAIGRLSQEIVARSGDITVLDWVGKPSEFNSCLPAEITSYTTPPHTRPSLSANEVQNSVSRLQKIVAVESALKLYTLFDSLSAPRFANSRLHLPCITFAITEVKKKRDEDQGTSFTYRVKADGLQDLSIETGDKLVQFSPARPTPQAFLLVCPWNRHDFGLPDFANGAQSVKEQEQDDLDSRSRALKLIVRLGQPFNALLLAQQRGSEYKRIASDHSITAKIKSTTAVHDMMGVKMIEIL